MQAEQKYQIMPPLSTEEYEALKADIALRGVQVPVEYDEDGNILDGYHRVQVCKELGIKDWPRVVRSGLDEEGKIEHALSLNANRRHLTREQRRDVVARLRQQGWSLRRIAGRLGVSDGTVRNDLNDGGAQFYAPDNSDNAPTVTGADGKQYPARRAERATEAEAIRRDEQPAPAKDWAADAQAPAKHQGSPPPLTPPSTPNGNMAVHYSSERMDWATPWGFFNRLDAEFGFDLDVCALPTSAKCKHFFTPEDDGLAQPWEGVCWMNPPYGNQIGDWMRKAYEESRRGATVVCLVPSRTDTNWWHEWAMKADEIRLVRGRLTFEGAETSAPFPSAVVVLRPGTDGPPRLSGVRADG
jgi:phage N-6-adenine-methyltransferase